MATARKTAITRLREASLEAADDRVAIEEPLQVTVDGHPIAVVMRTPGHDEDLTLGFLLSEGIISAASQVARIDLPEDENHARVFLADSHTLDLQRLTRHLFSASSCGICGKATVEAITTNHPPVTSPTTFASEAILEAPDTLRAAQATFDQTGGLHASGLFSSEGELLAIREDVGRHNAVDKILGYAAREGLETGSCFLMLSGRISFELMQKALALGIPLVAGISAPSSLAVEFAEASGQSLIGFLRPPTFNIYAGGGRVTT